MKSREFSWLRHDVVHCANDKCKDRKKCYRWVLMQEKEHHLCCVFKSRAKKKCSYFWSVEDK